jgi:alkylhydroperoxidase family enzyme
MARPVPSGMAQQSRTLAQSFESEFVDPATLEQRYKPMLALVRELIGVVPNCDRVLEIWPPGFRTYNLIVPNLLNLPVSLLKKRRLKRLVGLGMYASSRAAECAYCSAHCCSYALRRGVDEAVITGRRSPAEAAVVRVAEGLSRMPADLVAADVVELRKHLPPGDVDWVVMGIAMMGFLNKFMDALGIELEPEAVDDVESLISPTGWAPGQHLWHLASADGQRAHSPPPADSFRTYGRVLRQGPAAIRLEKSWTRGVPSDVAAAKQFLKQGTGVEFSTLDHLHSRRTVRAVASVLHENLSPAQSTIGLVAKGLVGLVFATVAGNAQLAEQARLIVLAHDAGFNTSGFTAVERFADAANTSDDWPTELEVLGGVTVAVLQLAKASSPSPAAVSAELVSFVGQRLSPAQIVETVVWISVQQMLHRIDTFAVSAGEVDVRS